MQRTLISETTEKIDQTVKISGWVKNRRDHGKIIFIDLRDRSGVLQCVVTPETENYEDTKKLRDQWVINFTGKIKQRPAKLINEEMKTGKVEMEVLGFNILSEAHELPIDISSGDMNLHLETLLDYRNLSIRNEKVSAIFKTYDEVLASYAAYLHSQNFVEIKTPKLLSACMREIFNRSSTS